MVKSALLIVDVQYDFLPPDGSLAVEGGRDILPHIRELLDTEQDIQWKIVVASQDFHPKGHISFASSHEGFKDKPFTTINVKDKEGNDLEQKLWPDHCIQGTHGSEIESSISKALERWNQQDRFHLVQKGSDPALDAYSAFATPYSPSHPAAKPANSALTQYLRSQGVSRIVICGIATDVCVNATAHDALEAGFDIILVRKAMAGVNKDASDQALAALADKGATVVEDVAELKKLL